MMILQTNQLYTKLWQNHHVPSFMTDRQFRNSSVHMHQFSRCIYKQYYLIVLCVCVCVCVCWGWFITVQNTAPHSSKAALQKIPSKWAYQSCERQAVKSAEWEFLWKKQCYAHTQSEKETVKTGVPNLSQAKDLFLTERWSRDSCHMTQ